MTIEATLERIAIALEVIANGKTPGPAMPSSEAALTPKAPRQRKSTSPAPAVETATAPAVETAAEPAASASKEETATVTPAEDDLFGENPAAPKESAPTSASAKTSPSTAPASKESQPKKESAASGPDSTDSKKAAIPSKEKPLTIDDVRAQLVLVQTHCGGKDAVFALLGKHTSDKSTVISKLPVESFATVIAEAKALVAAAKK
jgi:hypothetical protein